ncbi:MAG: hypothetical protein AAF909_08100 [Pseudomonadota bacterium]
MDETPSATDSAADAPIATRIDAAWAEARAAALAESEAAGPTPSSDDSAGRFLDALLAEGLICPVDPNAPAAECGAESEPAPYLSVQDDERTLYLFDHPDRLAASDLGFAEFVAAPGRVFFQFAAEAGAQIAFNPGVADSDSLFTVETVGMVAALASVAEEQELVGADETVEVAPPEAPTAALLSALGARLAAARDTGDPLAEAWLITIRRGGGGSGDAALTLALGVAAGADAESEGLGALARDLSRLGAVLAGPGGLDVALLADGERALDAARSLGIGLLERV